MKTNKLNDLDSKTWLKFQKSWFIHNPPPRKKDVLVHPAKFPETLAQEFIEFFTKRGQTVLDPMVGTGSTLIACLRSGRNGIGIELNPKYAKIAHELVGQEAEGIETQAGEQKTGKGKGKPEKGKQKKEKAARKTKESSSFVLHPSSFKIIVGDAARVSEYDLPPIDYVITSPPYWDMLRMRGAETQKKRRASDALDVFYSDDPNDLGNVVDYNEFVSRLCGIYEKLHGVMRDKAYLTIIVKNVKKGGKMYPLAWDIARELSKTFTLKDEKIWMQDNQRLAPYGLGSAWVSNTFHHYCLNFRKE